MKKLVTIVALLAVTAICFAGCGDKVRDDAEAKWDVFKMAETKKIGAEAGQGDSIPYDFDYRISEVDDAAYRFKGFINFKKGNTFQEQAYAFVEGSWLPVKYSDLKDEDELEEIEDKIEDLEDKIEDLEEDIEDDIEFLNKYEKRSKNLKEKKEKRQVLQKTLEDLKAELKK